MKTIRMAILASALMLGATTVAQAQQPAPAPQPQGQGMGRGMGRMNMVQMIKDSVTGLSAEQKTKLDAIATKYTAKMDSVRTAAAGDRQAMMQGMRPLQQEQQAEIKAVLTADQQAQLEKLMEAMRARMGAGRPAGPPPAI